MVGEACLRQKPAADDVVVFVLGVADDATWDCQDCGIDSQEVIVDAVLRSVWVPFLETRFVRLCRVVGRFGVGGENQFGTKRENVDPVLRFTAFECLAKIQVRNKENGATAEHDYHNERALHVENKQRRGDRTKPTVTDSLFN